MTKHREMTTGFRNAFPETMQLDQHFASLQVNRICAHPSFEYIVVVILGAYWLSLIYFATKEEHNLSAPRTVISVLIASLVAFLLKNTPQLAYMGLSAAIRLSG